MPHFPSGGTIGITLAVALVLWVGMLVTFKKAVLSRRHLLRMMVLLACMAILVVVVVFANLQSIIVTLAGIVIPTLWGFIDSLLQIPDSGRGKKRVALILKANTGYNRAVANAISSSLNARIPDVELKVFSSARGENANDQDSVFRQQLADKPDAIVIVPSPHNTPLAHLAVKAIQNGIAVISVDDQLDQQVFTVNKLFPPTFVGTNFHAGGRIAAQTMLKGLGGQGNVVIISGPLDSRPSQERKLAFIDEILLAKQHIQVVAARETSWNANEGGRQLADLIQAGFKIDGVFCCNDNLAIGVLNAFKQHWAANGGISHPTPIIIGFDGTSEIEPFILGREIYASVDVGTKAQGALIVDELLEFFKDRQGYLRAVHTELLTKPTALTRDILVTQTAAMPSY